MNLGKLINRLQQEDPNRAIPIGFCNPHSHRDGDYSLAFEIELDTDIGGLLAAAEQSVNQTFEGWKGGIYRITLDSDCWLVIKPGACGIKIDEELLDRLLFNEIPAKTAMQEIITSFNTEVSDDEEAGYILAMRLLQSDLDLDDREMGAIAQFTQPEVMRRVLRAMK